MKGGKAVESIVLVLVDINIQCMKNILQSASKDIFDQIILTGTTPVPSDKEKFDCDWVYYESEVDVALKLSNKGYEVVIGKSTNDSELLTEAEFILPKVAGFIGNISNKLEKLGDRSLHLALHNIHSDPNPSIVAGAVLHDIFCRREAQTKNRLNDDSLSRYI